MKNADFPDADLAAERFKKMLPPNLQDQDADDAQSKLAQAQSQLGQMGQQMQVLQLEFNKATDTIRKPLVDTVNLTFNTNSDDNDKSLQAGTNQAPGRTAPPGRPGSPSQRGSQSSRLRRRQADRRLGRPQEPSHPFIAVARRHTGSE